jgi:hypothetical protein
MPDQGFEIPLIVFILKFNRLEMFVQVVHTPVKFLQYFVMLNRWELQSGIVVAQGIKKTGQSLICAVEHGVDHPYSQQTGKEKDACSRVLIPGKQKTRDCAEDNGRKKDNVSCTGK